MNFFYPKYHLSENVDTFFQGHALPCYDFQINSNYKPTFWDENDVGK